ncbi:MAG: hypothetical protein ACYTGQ_02725 [Planctomycetota bacterium]|jgi:hypothetical protein
MRLSTCPTTVLVSVIMLSTGARAEDLTIDLGSLTPMSSRWADYFGTHYASTPDDAHVIWSTVRSYGGTHTGYYLEPNSDAPARKGPFSGKEIRIRLSDFHSRRGRKSAELLIPELIEHNITAVYLTTNIVRPSTEPFDKDLLYWGVRLIHERFPEANRHIVWQVGNEVVSGHFDPMGVWRSMTSEQKKIHRHREDNFFGYDLTWKEDYYADGYLAPAIEAIRRASTDVYDDPRKIRVALGSMNPYNRQNIAFLSRVMGRRFESEQAPTLRGQPVADHIDLLTVHYMTGATRSIETLQGYHDDYLMTGRVSGIWITEDHGAGGKGPVTILDRGLRFLAWAHRNGMSADQTRLCWWGENERDPGGRGKEATTLLGNFFEGAPLYFAQQSVEGGNVYTLSNGSNPTRVLIAAVPDRGESITLNQIRIVSSTATKNWTAESIRYSDTDPAQQSSRSLQLKNNNLTLSWDEALTEPAILLLTTD